MLFPAFSVIYSSREFFYSSYIAKISLFKIFSLNALGRKVLKQMKHVLLKNSNLIEKMASERAAKSQMCNGFSPFFLCRCSFLINISRRLRWRDEIWPVGRYMIDLGFGPENNNLIEKLESERAVKSKICNGFSPFFFVSPLFFNKLKQLTAAEGLNLAFGKRYD